MGERETWKCPMPDDVCEQCGYRCSAPAPAEAVAWKDALAVIQRHIEQLEGKERTAQFLAVTVSLEKNAGRTIGELHEMMRPTVDTLKHVPAAPLGRAEVGEADLAFITGNLLIDVDSCAMGTATESHYDVMARDLRTRIARALARPDRERGE